MSTDTTHATIDNDAAPRVFERIVVGVDDSPEALEAALQAASLRSARGTLDLCAVVESPRSVHGGFLALAIAGEMERASGEALDRAARRTRPTTTTVLHGKSVPGLLAQVRRRTATLLVVGSHDRRRVPGLLLGSTASVLLRDAPCSVLLARPGTSPDGVPQRIVAGIDGSPESERAAVVAEALAERFDARLELVVGLGGKLGTAHGLITTVVDRRPPVEALVAASTSADIVVLGNRGLHGLRALGSVSERVAHEARCSVLVVRDRSETGRGG